jgi:hypothetical protein
MPALLQTTQVVANSRCSETFVALCLLTVCGAALATSRLGLSDSLGAFIAGVLLSETSYRTQVWGWGWGQEGRVSTRALGQGLRRGHERPHTAGYINAAV